MAEYVIPRFSHLPHRFPDATQQDSGMMSAADKTKLDNIIGTGGFVNEGYEAFTSVGTNTATITMGTAQAGNYKVYLTPNSTDDALFVSFYYKIISPTQFLIVASSAFNGGFSWGTRNA